MGKTFAIIICCLILSGCGGGATAKKGFEQFLECAKTDISGDKIIYFGPSNKFGPGSIWRRADNNDLKIRADFSNMPQPITFISQGELFACNTNSTDNFELKAAVKISTNASPISFELSNDFKKAKKITVSATGLAWDTAPELSFKGYINKLPSDNLIRKDLQEGDRLVMYQALRVKGYTANLEFGSSDAAALKAKYSGALSNKLTGDIGVDLSATWTSDTTLTITSSGECYIAGTLSRFINGDFASSSSKIFGDSIIIPPNTSIQLELIK